ncbi:glycerophosphodiester phosphodiesterase [Halomicrococcus gelatinilyticus]|uniref:glycerophosphodiester phosphodiesterase n=1 Tax=Halomicrococcus gelatinilyticus TaxID=1702103 RepID=UPI0038992161
MRAVRKSSRRFPAVELDVRRCRTGELVVFHDETVDRVTDGTGSVAAMDWDRLRSLEVLESGERIPRLSEALAAIPSDVSVQVELKQLGVAADAVAAIAAADVDARVTSFLPSALAEVRDRNPELPLGYLFGESVGVETGLATAVALGCDTLHPHSTLCLETDVVDAAHAAGMDVVAWAADDDETFERLRAAGVDGATADDWPRATEELEPIAAD